MSSTAKSKQPPSRKELDAVIAELSVRTGGHDGLSAEKLIDLTTVGGLTYNDFLVLPGLSTFPRTKCDSTRASVVASTSRHRLPAAPWTRSPRQTWPSTWR